MSNYFKLIIYFFLFILLSSCHLFQKKNKFSQSINYKKRSLANLSIEANNSLQAQCAISICKNQGLLARENLAEIKNKVFKPDKETIHKLANHYQKVLANKTRLKKEYLSHYLDIDLRKQIYFANQNTKAFYNRLFYQYTVFDFAKLIYQNDRPAFSQIVSYDTIGFKKPIINLFQDYLTPHYIPDKIKKEIIHLFQQGYLLKEIARFIIVANKYNNLDYILSYLYYDQKKELSLQASAKEIEAMVRYAKLKNIDYSMVSFTEYKKILLNKEFNSNTYLGEVVDYLFLSGIIYSEKLETNDLFEKELYPLLVNKETPPETSLLLAALNDNLNSPYFSSIAREVFTSYMSNIITTASSEAKIRITKGYVGDLKKIIKQIINFKNDNLQSEFESYIENIDIEVNPSRPDILNLITNKFDEEIKKDNKKILLAANQKYPFKSTIFRDLTKDYFKVHHVDTSKMSSQKKNNYVRSLYEKNITSKLLNFVSSYITNTMSDHAYLKKIKISWSTVRSLKYGVGVIAHELSHHVKNFFDQKATGNHTYTSQLAEVPYWSKVNCIKNWHKNKPDQLIRNNPKYLTEDSADYLTSLILKEFEKNKSWVANPFCSIITRVPLYYESNFTSSYPSNYQWSDALQNILWNSQETVDFLESQKNVHSNYLFRVLNVQYHTGKVLPESCSKLIKQEQLFMCPEN